MIQSDPMTSHGENSSLYYESGPMIPVDMQLVRLTVMADLCMVQTDPESSSFRSGPGIRFPDPCIGR